MEEAGLGRTALSAREVERAGVLRRVKEGKLKLVSAARLLGISPRQGKRLWKRYQEQGIQGLQHRAAGREATVGVDSVPAGFVGANTLNSAVTNRTGGCP